jgi:hypothetical protein
MDNNTATMATTKGITVAKKAPGNTIGKGVHIQGELNTSKSATAARFSDKSTAVIPVMKRGPARLPGQEHDDNQRMMRYRRRLRVQGNKDSVVKHLCGDQGVQLKTERLRGFIIKRMDILLNYISDVGFGSNDHRKELLDIINSKLCIVAHAPCGYVGVVSMELMMGLLLDLHGDETTIATLGWLTIRKYPGIEEGLGRADYFMFHWEQNRLEKGSLRDGFVTDWKQKVKSLRKPTLTMIEAFARSILKGMGMCSQDDSDLEVDKKWAYFPGLVRTIVPYNQVAHQDMGDRTGFIIHMPLTKEGLVLMILPTHRVTYPKKGGGAPNQTQKPGNSQPIYLFIPFGCYLVLPSSVNHAGVYGHQGNLRFHMGIRLRDDGDWGTDTLQKDESATKHNSNQNNFINVNWKKEMIGGQVTYSEFSKVYTTSLKERFGMLLGDAWMNLLSPDKMNMTTKAKGQTKHNKSDDASVSTSNSKRKKTLR